MEYIPILQSIRMLNPFPAPNIDNKYGPYSSLSEAKSKILSSERAIGLTVGIITNNSIEEYWWKEGINDSQLVVKTPTTSNIQTIVTPIITSSLTNYATQDDLTTTLNTAKTYADGLIADKVTTSSLTTTLNNYVQKGSTTGTLTEVLNSFFTKTEINTKLEDYVLTTALSGYYTSSQVDNKFTSYYNQTEINTKLSGYATTSSISGFITQSTADQRYALSSSLRDYVQTSYLTTNYLTKTYIEDNYLTEEEIEDTYVPITTLSSYYTNTTIDRMLTEYATTSSLSSYLTINAAQLTYVASSYLQSNYYDKVTADNTFAKRSTAVTQTQLNIALSDLLTSAAFTTAVVDLIEENVSASCRISASS